MYSCNKSRFSRGEEQPQGAGAADVLKGDTALRPDTFTAEKEGEVDGGWPAKWDKTTIVEGDSSVTPLLGFKPDPDQKDKQTQEIEEAAADAGIDVDTVLPVKGGTIQAPSARPG